MIVQRHAEPGEELRELDGDHPAADEGDARRELRQRGRLPVRPEPGFLEARNRWDHGLGARGDDDRAAFEHAAAASTRPGP